MANETRSFRDRMLHVLHVVPGGSLLFALIPLVIFGYWGWYHYGAIHIDRTFYSLKVEQVQISTQPAWIKSSVLKEVFKEKRLDRINTLDPAATADIASAFETHPWVRSAKNVQKYSGGVTVDLVYRQPLAMLQVPYQDSESGKWTQGFYPIDQDGVVLPVSSFSKSQVSEFEFLLIDIENIDRTPEGMAYADVRVHHALKLAQFLEASGQRSALEIQWLRVTRDNDVSTGRPWLLQLLTAGNRMVIWGHTPGEEVGGENPPDRKLSDLANWLKSEREKESKGGQLDLSTGKVIPGQTASSKDGFAQGR